MERQIKKCWNVVLLPSAIKVWKQRTTKYSLKMIMAKDWVEHVTLVLVKPGENICYL